MGRLKSRKRHISDKGRHFSNEKNIGLFASLNHLEEINGIRLDLTSRSRAFMLSNLRPAGNGALDQFMALLTT